MRVLILGGTGPMGGHLAETLQERVSEVVVTSRTARVSKGNIHFLQGSAKEPDFLNPLLGQWWDAIIDFMVYSTGEFKSKLDSFLAATDQYFFLSSARVYAASDEPLTEAFPRLLDVSEDKNYLATDEYGLAKARQENCLFGHQKKNWTIIRPYITYGPGRLQLGVFEKEAWLYRALRGREVVFSEDIARCTTTMTHGRDVAQAMASLVGENAARGQAFHITGPHYKTWQYILDLYSAKITETGQAVNIKNVDLEMFIRCHGNRYQVIYDRLYNRTFNNSKINQFYDTSEFEPIEVGLGACCTQFLKLPSFSRVNWRLEGVKDRITQDYAYLSEFTNVMDGIKYYKERLAH